MKPKVKVSFKGVSKKYYLYKKQSDKLLDVFLSKKKSQSFYALRDISFEVYEGETIGVIGINGSGKSTLSNLLAQVVPATSGSINISGHTSLIAISAGLNNNLSGLENIELKCLMLGLKKEQINNLTPEIIEFADIGDFIYQPVKNYSSGMKSRLGFAISVHTNPDILIVDEALSVGDQTFYDKCLKKINEFKENGKTIFFISHSISQVRSMSDKILWLNYGEIEEFGNVRVVIEKYKEFISWFNQLSEMEKKNYKSQKLREQMTDNVKNSFSKNKFIIRRERNNKKKKINRENSVTYSQVLLLLLTSIISLSIMFVGNPVKFISEQITDLNEVKLKDQNENKSDKISDDKTAINENGIVEVSKADLYLDEKLTEKTAEIPFASSVHVLKEVKNVFKVSYESKTGFTATKNIKIGELTKGKSSLTINDVSNLFPRNFSDAYQYYLAQLNLNEEIIQKKLKGLSAETVDLYGNKILEYQYDSVTLVIDQETNIATSIIVNNINSESDTLDELKNLAQLKSKNRDLLFLTLDEYNLTVNLINNTIIISIPKN